MLVVLAVTVVVMVAVVGVHQRQPVGVVLSEEVALPAARVRELAVGVHLRLVRVAVPYHDHAPHRRGAEGRAQRQHVGDGRSARTARLVHYQRVKAPTTIVGKK